MSIKIGLEYIGYIDPWTDEVRLSDEKIVRCRECRFCGKGQWGVEAFPICRRGIHAFQVSNDGFCAWGERRDA